MTVEFVWATPNAEAMITAMARVSAPQNQNNMETAPRLLAYLIKHKHWSPFEMANLCIKIRTERDISAQITRHGSFSFQEYSTRYAEAQSYTVPVFRRQDIVNRQNSIDDLSQDMKNQLAAMTEQTLNQCEETYQTMLRLGVAKETARRILPLCTKTTLYMNGTLRSYIHYIQVRADSSTQLEHRKIAIAIKDIFCKEFPVIGKAVFDDQ
ncbi:FAD dependent thymidylate synthase [Synechococcus phage S-EIVl]|nr:FAD dependent thymidylate synthase [Synechococcus phage S-EIVl]